ncbi:MAG: Lacal_2735 family protein [Cyclobacteriaceae bacterium]
MFNLFSKKSKLPALQKKYKKLQEEAYTLSKTNRSASDKKVAEAEEIQKLIVQLIAEES